MAIVHSQVSYDRWMKEVKMHFFTGLASTWINTFVTDQVWLQVSFDLT